MKLPIGKILPITLLTGALLLALKSATGLSRLQSELKMTQRVALEGNKVKVYVTLINPTDGYVTIKHPTVTITYKDTVLVTSPALNKDYKIAAFANTLLNPIELQVNPGAITTLPAMLIEAASGKVTLASTVTITLYNTLPKTDRKEFQWSLPHLKKTTAGQTVKLSLKT